MSTGEHEGHCAADGRPRRLSPTATILLVADDKDLLELLAFTLERDGLTPARACDGLAALRLVRARRPQAAVVDYRVAVYDGPLVLRHLRQLRLPLLVLISSGDQASARATGVRDDELLIKPISPQELVKRLRASLCTGAQPNPDQALGVVCSSEPRDLPRPVRPRIHVSSGRSTRLSRSHATAASVGAVALLLVTPMLLYQHVAMPAVSAPGLAPARMASTPLVPQAQPTAAATAHVPLSNTPVAAPPTLIAVAPASAAAVTVATPSDAVAKPLADPAETVVEFYYLLQRSDFENITPLLSGHMRDTVPWDPKLLRERTPPGELRVERAEVVEVDPSYREATVAVEVVETGKAESHTKRYVGTWQVVRGPVGWQLDQPDLHIEQG